MSIFELKAPTSDKTSKFGPLEDGMYPANCVAIVIREMKKFNSDELQDKAIFIFQVSEGDRSRYVKSKPFTLSLHEKSALWKTLSAWTKQKTPEALVEKLGQDGSFKVDSLIGKPVSLVLGTYEFNGNEYNEINAYMAPKPDQQSSFPIKSETLPEFITRDAKMTLLANGMSEQGDGTDIVIPTFDEDEDEISDPELPF